MPYDSRQPCLVLRNGRGHALLFPALLVLPPCKALQSCQARFAQCPGAVLPWVLCRYPLEPRLLPGC